MEIFQQIASVVAVLGLLVAALWWLRRNGMAQMAGASALSRRKADGLLRRVERLSLSPTHSLHLVRMADRAILISSSPTGCQVLESAPWSHMEKTELERRP